MIAHADNVTLADVRASVITSGVIPDTYLIKPTGTYWDSKNTTIAYNFLKSWIESKDESIPSSLFQNKVNRALFNTAMLLEGRADSIHQITALVTAKERVLGTYNENGYLKKYHDYIINNHNIPNTANGIDTALSQALGNMTPLAGEITSVANRAASIAGIPNDLLESDFEYWVDVEIATYCKLDKGVNHPHCTPGAGNQTGIISGESPTVSASWYWRASACLSSYGGTSYGAICSNTASKSGSTTFYMDSITNQIVTGHLIISKLTVNNAPSDTKISTNISVNAGKRTTGEISKTGSGTFSLSGYWVAWNNIIDHPCYKTPSGYDAALIPICVASNTWTFSGTSKITIPDTGTGTPKDTGTNQPTYTSPSIDNIPENMKDTAYTGREYIFNVAGNKVDLTYTVSITDPDNSEFTISDNHKPTITTSGKNGVLTWDIPSTTVHDYTGTYTVNVTATDDEPKSDTKEFTLTVRENNIPELTTKYDDDDGKLVGTETTEVGRFLGELQSKIKYYFEGMDADADHTLTLSVSDPPSRNTAAITDCVLGRDRAIHEESGSEISRGIDRPLPGSVCLVGLNVGEAESFTVQLSDGVDSVSKIINFKVVDYIWFALNLVGAAAHEVISIFELPSGATVFIEGSIDRVLVLIGEPLTSYWSVVLRCEEEYFRDGDEENDDKCNCNLLHSAGPGPRYPSAVCAQSHTSIPQWTVIANITNTANITVHDTDLEPNKVYTYAARVFVGNKSSDYIPLGNVTTPADGPPVITLKGSSTMTILLGTPYVEPGYSAIDFYDGNVTDDMTVSGNVDVNREGNYNIFYYASDSAGNLATPQKRIVFVIDDSTPPVLTLKGSKTISMDAGLTYTDPGYSAIDNKDGNITDNVVVTGTVNTRVPGVYTIQYDVSDRVGNKAPTQTRTVTIIGDDTPPTITLKGNKTITIEAGLTYVDPGYTATDNRDGNITDMVTVTGTVDTNIPGTYTIQYDVIDSSSNAAIQQIRTVTVVDTIPPTLTLKGDSSITIPASVPYVEPGYTATDNIDGNVRVEIVGWVNPDRVGSYSLQYTAYDSSGNSAPPQIRMIIVEDMTPPVITLKGNSSITVPASMPYVDPGYTAIDNIDGDITGRVVISGMVDTDTLGDYTIYYDVSDGARNAAIQQSRTITVVDLTPPVITLTGNATVTIPMGPTYTDPGYTATDNIDGDITSMVAVSGTVNPLIPGTYTIQYMVTDTAGNTINQDRVVTVSPPTDTTLYCNSMTLAQLMASGKYNIINKMFSSDSNIKGTNNADLIISGNNGPTIEGKAGDDCIIGGSGNDTILGQVGNDIIFGNGGNDEIRGGDNKDTIYGGSGNDELHGGSGHDTIHGESGADEIHGGAGNDTIYGGSEDDKILGLNGNDTIYGEGGNDTIYAGPGNDTIYGGPGTDTIEAGETDTVHDDDSNGE